MMKIPYYHKDGGHQPGLRTRLRRDFYAYLCCNYDLAMPNYMVHDEMTFRISRNNDARLSHDTDVHMSTTSSRL